MKVLVFGKTGQVARELAALDPKVQCLGREDADLSDPEACATAIRKHAPDAVINAAAYTSVDQAEWHEKDVALINGLAPGAMALTCAELDIPFVHLSTDYVFDGAGDHPFGPGHPTGPLGVYGVSKRLGERAVMAAGGTHAVVRTSWVFSAHGKNFLKSMLKLFGERDRLEVVADQVGGPTPARAIARACLEIARQLKTNPEKTDIYHLSGAPDVSWKTFAEEIASAANAQIEISAITTDQYPTPAARPLNSRLDCTSLEAAFGIKRPDWRSAVQQIVAELT
jgi:dTDP-4-dehydrorhamnose reductase